MSSMDWVYFVGLMSALVVLLYVVGMFIETMRK